VDQQDGLHHPDLVWLGDGLGLLSEILHFLHDHLLHVCAILGNFVEPNHDILKQLGIAPIGHGCPALAISIELQDELNLPESSHLFDLVGPDGGHLEQYFIESPSLLMLFWEYAQQLVHHRDEAVGEFRLGYFSTVFD
jgi:hypothetical protein